MHHSLLKGALLACTSFALFTSSCNIKSSNAETHKQGLELEAEHEPNPDENNPVTVLAKTTGVTMLTNITELGFFDGAGRTTCMVIDLADSNHLIAGAESGGLWQSHNRGKSWTPIDDHLPTLYIRSLTQNPLQTNTYYASSHVLMATTPGGFTYRPDIYKSTDGGQTFQLLPATAGTFSQVIKVVCDPNNVNTVYALSDQFSSNARGLYRSTNGGQTFTQVFPVIAGNNVQDLEILPNGTVLVCVDNNIYRSTTGNTGSFTPANGLNGANTFSAIDVGFCQGSSNNLYGVSTGGNSGVGVFKSTDGGQNWSFVQSLASGSFTRTVGIKPNNPAFVFAGSVGMYLSQNSGSSFVFYGTGGVDWWSVNFDPHNPDKVFNTFDGGIVEISLNPFNPNNNTAYVRRDSLLNCSQIYAGDYFPVGDKVIAGMQDLGTRMTWITGAGGVAGSDGGQCFFNKQDTTVAYGTTQNGGIFKKTNLHIPFPQPGFTQPVDIANQLDANNDGAIDEGVFFIHPFWMNNADGQQLYFPTKKRLWRSIDGGSNWTPITNYYNLPPGSGVPYIEGNNKTNPVVYWGVADTLHVFPNAKTASVAGELKVKMPGILWGLKPDPANDSFVYITLGVTGSGGRIFHSSNLFKPNVTWTDLTGDLPVDVFVRAIEVSTQNPNQLVAGTGGGLYVSSDGGVHWDIEQQLPFVNILRLKVRPSDNRLFIFTYGRGAWAASFPPATAVHGPATQEALSVWPNPAKDILHVGIPQLSNNTSIRVYDMGGRLVQSMSGIQSVPASLSLSGLPAGTYMVALYEGNRKLRTARVTRE